MLTLIIPGDELFDEDNSEFITTPETVLLLEHSLVSLSKWESNHQKPFLSTDKTTEQTVDYIRFMIVSPDFPPGVFSNFTHEHFDQINAYIDSPYSATTFGEMPQAKGRGETVTAELIYYWMIAFNIPFECQHWHLNRLFALIRICNIKNSKPKKMTRREIAERNRKLNEERRARLGTSG